MLISFASLKKEISLRKEPIVNYWSRMEFIRVLLVDRCKEMICQLPRRKKDLPKSSKNKKIQLQSSKKVSLKMTKTLLKLIQMTFHTILIQRIEEINDVWV